MKNRTARCKRGQTLGVVTVYSGCALSVYIYTERAQVIASQYILAGTQTALSQVSRSSIFMAYCAALASQQRR